MFEYWMNARLDRLATVQITSGRAFNGDQGANLFGVKVEGVSSLTGTVSANIVKPDGTTITQSGSKDGNKAWVVLPEAAYTVKGKIIIAIKLTNGTEVATLGAFEIYVR